ncbi:hypothetical protein LTS12_025909 [Elasticomyces elasticus]|nr:hypothetical protein LTS12_025909 [Elasticomyces elasticus]
MPEQVTKSNNSFVDCEGQPVLTITANILTIIAAIAQLTATAVGLHQRTRANVVFLFADLPFQAGADTSALPASSLYTTQPLDSEINDIRLNDISPTEGQQDGHSRNHVSYQLRCVDLNTKPDFSALSSAWVNEANPTDISVNGIVTPVTPTLGSALSEAAPGR